MSTYKSSEQIRQSFLDFFREKGHEIVPSAPLVPQNDPTLLFTNAGMNQFKDVFLGTGTRPYRRAANTQKCLRVSGKHNDLEEVGHDTYHHTFFEMLGNWSFGDYFKREAIRWAWELLVERWGLDPDRLYVTVHEGDEALGLAPDTEAADLWKSETSIDPSHIKFCPTKDNFWMMGDTGPCGPCSEIHIDLRPDEERQRVPGITLVNADDPRVIEIWNLVFIQYNALPDGRLEPLKAKHVDTGMGLERIVAVLQGKTSNYDTDLFAPILQRAAELSPRPEVRGYDDLRVEDERERERIRVALRVVADHIRAIAFAIADGVVPGNTGRGYVIRRILRRAVRYGYQTLNFREPFLYRLVEPLAHKMGNVFPEIERHRAYVERVIRAEEESFLATLGTGLAFFERLLPYLKAAAEGRPIEAIREDLQRDSQAIDLLQKAYVDTADRKAMVEAFLKSAAEKNVPGEVAFLLHDTYGFPIDLTQLMAREEGLGVDMARYEELMQRQRERARAASTFGAVVLTADDEEAGWKRISEGEDSVFVGYDTTRVEAARIRALRTVETPHGPRHELVLDQTPFYAESGGQVGDTGVLRVGDEEIQVRDTQKLGGHIVHYVDRLPKEPDAPVEAVVDAARRKRIEKHHTATHLLHAALREILGTHVQQKGSLVAPDRLRFDFSHFERVTPELLRQIEARVNEVIQRNVPRIEERDVPFQEAIARGAMALFGEKYGDRVRVITFDPNFSMELCGGTHVAATGELGVFRIISEGSVASGIRRVEALAGQEALNWINQQLSELEQARGQFKSLQRPLDEEIALLLETQRRLEKELAALRRAQQKARLATLVEQAHRVNGLRVVTGEMEALSMDELRELVQALRDQMGREGVAVLGTTDPEKRKVYLAAAVTDDVVGRGVEAGRLVGEVARIVGGGGGGRPTLATAGGRQPEKLREALEAVPRLVQQMVG
ncbi:alanine--tRNA ligase [Rhodothermus profundi]|nr:alanine--tRNA ligase [Rhodothermus profundi]